MQNDGIYEDHEFGGAAGNDLGDINIKMNESLPA